MQANLYNNPLFAVGLTRVLQDFIGNPRDAAAAELAAAEAGNLNDTREYRRNIGTAGGEQDLAGLLISSLQAGKDYSGNAPKITSSLASLPEFGFDQQTQGNIQVGTGVQKASGTFAGRNGGGGGGRRSSGGGRAPVVGAVKPRGLTRGATAALMAALEDKGFTADEIAALAADADDYLTANPGMTENRAMADIIGGASVEDVVTDSNDSWFNPLDWVTGPETERVATMPNLGGGQPAPAVAAAPDEAESILNEARAALAAGAPADEVRKILEAEGIDPGRL